MSGEMGRDTTARVSALRAIGRPQEAERLARQGLLANPDDLQLRCHLVEALRTLHRTDEAVEQAREAIRVDPARPDGYGVLAVALYDQRDYEAALAAAREVVRLDPENVHGHRLVARINLMLAARPAAREAVEQVLRLQPDHVDARRTLAMIEIDDGHPERAEPVLRTLLVEHPDDLAATRLLGKALSRMGRRADARRLLVGAYRLDPADQRTSRGIAVELSRPERAPWLLGLAVVSAAQLAYAAVDASWFRVSLVASVLAAGSVALWVRRRRLAADPDLEAAARLARPTRQRSPLIQIPSLLLAQTALVVGLPDELALSAAALFAAMNLGVALKFNRLFDPLAPTVPRGARPFAQFTWLERIVLVGAFAAAFALSTTRLARA